MLTNFHPSRGKTRQAFALNRTSAAKYPFHERRPKGARNAYVKRSEVDDETGFAVNHGNICLTIGLIVDIVYGSQHK
jgi:hypothetical protein